MMRIAPAAAEDIILFKATLPDAKMPAPSVAPLLQQLELPLRLPPDAAVQRCHILLGARIVPFALTRSGRRTLGMTVDQRGLRVGAPRAMRLAEVEQFLRKNQNWILQKLDDWRAAGRTPRLLVCDGAALPLFGESWNLRVTRGPDLVRWCDGELMIEARDRTEPRDLLLRALRERALALFRERAAVLIRPLGRPLPRVALSNAQTRWGSCSSKSGLRVNWRLIHLPLRLTDYVVAHELAHLVEMNHSRRFWDVVERLFPDFRTAREELRTQARFMPCI